MSLFGAPEKEIVASLETGKNIETSIQRLYDRYWRSLTGFLAHRVGVEAQEAQDLAQEALILLVRRIRKGGFKMEEKDSLRAYLYKVALHLAWQMRRNEQKRTDAENAFAAKREESEILTLEEEEVLRQLAENAAWERWSRLGEKCRILLQMVAEGFKAREIQEALGLETEGNVRVRKMRCLKQLAMQRVK